MSREGDVTKNSLRLRMETSAFFRMDLEYYTQSSSLEATEPGFCVLYAVVEMVQKIGLGLLPSPSLITPIDTQWHH
jgi:hypothetical protein